jgi:serine protease Do
MNKKAKKTTIILWSLVLLSAGFLLATVIDPISKPLAQQNALVSNAPVAGIVGQPLSFVDLAKKTKPAVVNISVEQTVKGQGNMQFRSPFNENDPFRDFFDRFFNDQQGPKEYKQRGLGTGFIIDKEGYILTNNHVIAHSDKILVKLSDKKEYSAKVIGSDPKTDLALIKIEPKESLPVLPLGDSDKLEVGEWVIAIGNPFGLEQTVTAGIVSAKYRDIHMGPYDNFIQTDASINRGNSGGPLLNTRGEVVGINAVIMSDGMGSGSVGIGFAIPVNMAKDLLPQLKEGKIVRGWLGVGIQEITPELKEKFNLKDNKGALVADVTADSPADKAGIKRGDAIVAFDGKEVNEFKDLPLIVSKTPVNKTVTVDVLRKGEKKSLKVKVGELKDNAETQVADEESKTDLGLSVQELTPELAKKMGLKNDKGLVVTQVEKNSPADDAELRPGDVIREVDQKEVKDVEEFNKQIKSFKKGDTILFLVERKGNTLFRTLKLND